MESNRRAYRSISACFCVCFILQLTVFVKLSSVKTQLNKQTFLPQI